MVIIRMVILSCPERTRYLDHSDTLEDYRVQALTDIRQVLDHPAIIAQSDREFRNNRAGLTIPSPIKIITCEYNAYRILTNRPNTRGSYHKNTGKIILCEDKWCKDTLIHEVIHSVSILSKEEYLSEGDQIRSFKEAMTEFLTGLVLFRRHRRTCYNAWKMGNYPQWCNVSYKPDVQTLCALASWVSVQEFINLFLWRPNNDWEDRWSHFTNIVLQVCPDFEDNYDDWKLYDFMTELKNELSRKLGRKFRSKRNLFNYNFILP